MLRKKCCDLYCWVFRTMAALTTTAVMECRWIDVRKRLFLSPLVSGAQPGLIAEENVLPEDRLARKDESTPKLLTGEHVW